MNKVTTPEKIIFETQDARLKHLQKTQDGFQNFAAKLGVVPPGEGGQQNANLLSAGNYQFNLVTRNRVLLEAAYRGSWIVGQVIDAKAKDMTRAGIDITTNKAADKVAELETMMKRLKIWQSISTTKKWGDLYGGACGVLQIKGQNIGEPIDLENIKQDAFLGIVVYDRWQLYPVLDKLIDSGPDMGLPAYYDIVLGSNLNDPGREPGGQITDNPNQRVRVHHSRCVRMIGIELPFWQAITEMMWGESVLERLWDRLIMFDDASLSTGNLISRAQLRTVGIEGLREILAAGGEAQAALVAQFEYMRLLQNNEGISLLDKEDTFASTAYSFAGLSDVLLQFGQQVSGACGIPLVRLFGQSPAGLNSTGDGDIRLYYDGIQAEQEASLRNPIEIILKVLWRSMYGEAMPDDLTFSFTPLWQMSATDKATIAKTNTDTIIEAHGAGLVDSATAMQELKQSSGDTGLFTHISDEHISDAENEDPPNPEIASTGQQPEPGASGKGEQAKPGTKPKGSGVGDSAWMKIKKWLVKDQAVSKTTQDISVVKTVQVNDDAQKIKEWLAKHK